MPADKLACGSLLFTHLVENAMLTLTWLSLICWLVSCLLVKCKRIWMNKNKKKPTTTRSKLCGRQQSTDAFLSLKIEQNKSRRLDSASIRYGNCHFRLFKRRPPLHILLFSSCWEIIAVPPCVTPHLISPRYPRLHLCFLGRALSSICYAQTASGIEIC